MTRRMVLFVGVPVVVLALAAASASAFGGWFGGGVAGVPAQPFQESACCSANCADFAKNGGDDGNQNFSSLDQINLRNVSRLSGAWQYHLEGGSTARASRTRRSSPTGSSIR